MSLHIRRPNPGEPLQADIKSTLVQAARQTEEKILQLLDELVGGQVDVDIRWISIGRTSIEQGFMAIVRGIERPARVSVPETVTVESGWLIEDADSPAYAPAYFAGGPAGPAFTPDHFKAMRFARKDDAEAFALMSSGTLDGVRIAFHEWSADQAATAARPSSAAPFGGQLPAGGGQAVRT